MVSLLSCKNLGDDLDKPHKADILTTLLTAPSEDFVAVVCDKPWEQELSFPVVVKVDDHYNMYYGTYTGKADDRSRYFALCLATSIDGKKWTKPNLGICEFDGDYNTNIT